MRSIFKQLRTLITRSKRASAGVDIFQLLGREPVCLDTPELQRFLAGKSILVTGAGGSIGSEICRQSMKFCPRRLVLLERAENALFEIDRELRERWIGADIRPCLADICDEERIDSIFKEERPDVVFHCAAHKHVPLMEENPGEAVKNNVFGTKIVADAAVDAGCHAFVMVSTDKAVNPTSVMGATKRCAELYVQSLNGGGGTRFVAVRFGNVIGSSGSVVPIFQKQIAAGGPVTVTHPDMKRYFMTIPEASQLVMQAGAIGRGGEIFILDMGEPVKILDLAIQMIVRNGLKPDEDIQIKFTGIRPGEKLYEELSATNEQTRPTSQEKIRVWQLPIASTEQVELMLEILSNSLPAGPTKIVDALKQCVGEYEPKRAATAAPGPEKSRIPLRLVRAA
ncbi:MAG TPA: nucleoside-diphosphate sugar epimerase/dehydratase [Tepidisphaeraceae bacterium]|nr:nucleoside-diphosphate sugar epimerase/dehydratase [Tepidisphaeraceae bacterium]